MAKNVAAIAGAKEGAKPAVDGPDRKYDVVYCAGLFDYLPDRTCLQLMNVLYDWLAPGGLLAATNVEDCKPFRHMLEFVLEWHLIYRGVSQSADLVGADVDSGAGGSWVAFPVNYIGVGSG